MNKTERGFSILLSAIILLGMVFTGLPARLITARAAGGTFGGGNGTSDAPYIIEDAADLDAVRNDLSAHYILGIDIDLTEYLAQSSKGWLPIGDGIDEFTGSLDGDGHKIKGLWIDQDDFYPTGLFSQLAGTIKNLGVETDTAKGGVSGTGDVGVLAGILNCGSIERCYSTGSVTGTFAGIGGLVGEAFSSYIKSSTISDSYSTCSVTGGEYSSYMGGLAGGFTGTLIRCYATGNVTGGISQYSGSTYLGGLVGYMDGNFAGSRGVTDCYATGNVSGYEYIGGLVGYSFGEFKKCYAAGTVTKKSGYAGALVGYNENGAFTSCYFDSNIAGNLKGCGNSAQNIIGKTTDSMKQETTFSDWDFTDVWSILEDVTYPYLNLSQSNNQIFILEGISIAKTYGDEAFKLSTAGEQGIGQITWKSSNESIASVDNDGIVTIHKAGAASITVKQEAHGGYDAAQASIAITVNKAVLTATAAASRPYNTDNPPLTITYTGFVGKDGPTSITLAPTASTTAKKSSNVGDYPISLSGGQAENYTFSYVKGILTVTPAAQTPLIVIGGNVTKNYGDAGFQLTTSGGSGNGTVTWSSDDDCVSIDNNGNVTINGAGTATVIVTKAGDGNYQLSAASIVITVNKKTLNVYVNNEQREYGQENPAFTVTYDGFVNNEDEDALTAKPTAACAADAATPVGSVPIVLSGGVSGNYEFGYNNGMLVINKAGNTTFMLNDGLNVNKTYGDGTFTLTTSDAKGAVTFESKNESVATVDTSGEVTIIGAGETQINAYDAGDSNFNPVTAAITVTVAKKAITVTADDKEKYFGSDDSALTWTAGGLLSGDTLTGSLKYEGSAVGEYDIVEDEAFADPNYDITFTKGTMTIKQTPTAQDVIEFINDLPDPDDIDDNDKDFADDVADATNAFDALPDDVKDQIPNDIKDKLKEAQDKAGEINRKDGDVTVTGDNLPWYVRVVATPVPESDSRYSAFFDKLTDKKLLALYDIKLINTMTGEDYELPDGETVTVELCGVTLTGEENIAITHHKADGTIEAITATVKNGKMTFTASAFSLYGVTATADATDSTEPIVPGTGDNSNMTFWLLLGGASLTVISGMSLTRRRRKHQNIIGGGSKR